MNLRRDVFQAIADPTRRAILVLVASQSMTAGAIASNFDTARPTVFRANGTIHEFVPDKKITRTFEMDGSPFDAQLEFLELEGFTEDTSRLTIQSIYRSAELRDEMLKLPFAAGLSMAHDRLQANLAKFK